MRSTSLGTALRGGPTGGAHSFSSLFPSFPSFPKFSGQAQRKVAHKNEGRRADEESPPPPGLQVANGPFPAAPLRPLRRPRSQNSLNKIKIKE